MTLTLEALDAKHGDSLLLLWGKGTDPNVLLIDGGPSGVYVGSLSKRLKQLRDDRGDHHPLPLELVVVTHLDDDHVNGILELLDDVAQAKQDRKPAPWNLQRLWGNTFDDIIGNPATAASLAASLHAQVGTPGEATLANAVMASVGQGRTLRGQAKTLGLNLNAPLGTLALAQPAPVVLDGLTLHVLCPSKVRLDQLLKEWDAKLKANHWAQAAAVGGTDRSPYNLSSIVLLAEADGRTMLLAGDALCDDILGGLTDAGLLKDGGAPFHVDVFKLPHHGSKADASPLLFQRVVASHYVISADGTNGNPDPETLQMLTDARKDDDFTIHMTYPVEHAMKFFEAQKAGKRRFKVVVREADALSIVI